MSTVAHETSTLSQRIARVRRSLTEAAQRANRSLDEITLVAVSKTHPAASIEAAIAEGLADFGENRVQEAEQKIPSIGRHAAKWHLIGHLQSIARTYWLEGHGGAWMSQTVLAIIALFFPDLQLFNLIDDIVADTFIPTAILIKTTAVGGFYSCFYLLLAWLVFSGREL